MLYIKDKDSFTYQWHVGEQFPVSFVEIQDITEIQADGDELELIFNSFSNLVGPSNARVVRWFGDTAKMIAASLIE